MLPIFALNEHLGISMVTFSDIWSSSEPKEKGQISQEEHEEILRWRTFSDTRISNNPTSSSSFNDSRVPIKFHAASNLLWDSSVWWLVFPVGTDTLICRHGLWFSPCLWIFSFLGYRLGHKRGREAADIDVDMTVNSRGKFVVRPSCTGPHSRQER